MARHLHLGTQVTRYRAAAAQVWISDGLARQVGIDATAIGALLPGDQDKLARETTRDLPFLTDAIAAGYTVGGKGGLGRWTRVRRGEDRGVWIVLRAAVDTQEPFVEDQPDNATLARRIGMFTEALGHPFHMSGQTTGLDLMMAMRGKRDEQAWFAVREPVPPAQITNAEIDFSWCRPPSGDETAHRYLHAYDRSGSYLAGVAGLDLGVGDPVEYPDGIAFHPVPGYWQIQIPEAGDWRIPNPLDPRGSWAGRASWVTTPTLQYARDLGYDPQVLSAWIWPTRARVLEPWYERIRDARMSLDVDDVDAQAARDQLKTVYTRTIGMMGSSTYMEGRVGYAPDWRHLIIGKARTNVLRRVVKIGELSGRWPVAMHTDTIIYTSDSADPVQAWPGRPEWLGRELGKYKPDGSALLDEHLEYLTGGPYRGKPAIAPGRAGDE